MSAAANPAGLEWMRTYFPVSSDCVMVLKASGKVLACNHDLPHPVHDDEASQMFGGLFDSTPDSPVSNALLHVLASRQPVYLETEGPRPDGSRAWYKISMTPLPQDAEPARVTLIATDITERKREEERLRRSEEMMVDTQGVAHLGVWEWDITQPHATWSPELYRIYGLEPSRYVPSYENYLSKVHPDDRQRAMNATNGVFNDLKPYSHDERIIHADGSVRYLHTWAFPVLDDDGKLERLTGVCQDITDRKLAENALASHAAKLDRVNADLEQFARIAAHDLQEPLRTVASFVQLLEVQYRGQLDADADETIDFIVQGVHRMKAVITDLLEYSELSVRSETLQHVDLTEAVRHAQDALHSMPAAEDMSFSFGQLPVVLVNPSQLHRLLVQLFTNAMNFRGVQAPRVKISAKIESGMVEVIVQDNGMGIAPAHLERIFVIFQRLDSESPGTGAGLAICKKIVELHKGKIWARSQQGQGTSIHFTLPAVTPSRLS